MQKLLLFLIFFSINICLAQTAIINTDETKEAFIKRIAPANATEIKIILQDKLNSATAKIIYSYSIMEAGNLIDDGRRDSSKCMYAAILCEQNKNEYSMQSFKTNSSYLHTIKVESAEIVTVRKIKQLQINVTENVRGPGGVMRGVTRNFIFNQKKEGDLFLDIFEPVNN